MKKQKSVLLMVALTSAMALMTTGCSLMGSDKVERAESVIEAYQTGDLDKFQSYVDDEDSINYLIDAVEVSNADGMQEVYQKVYELTKSAEVTVTATADDASNEYATVTIETVDIAGAFHEAMAVAAIEGGEAFADVPGWMMDALNGDLDTVEYEVQARTMSNGKLYDGFNDEFFSALTGGFYEYIPATMTTCTSTDGYDDKTYMLAVYDVVTASLDEYNFPFEGVEYTEDEINAVIEEYTSVYAGYDGIEVGGKVEEDRLVIYMYIDYEVVDISDLEALDLVTSGYGSDISLEVSIEGYESDGFECETTDFGSGVLAD